MIYAILAYHEPAAITGLTSEEDAGLMDRLMKAHDRIGEAATMGPAARLDFTEAAATLRKGVVIDGPFAETKEHLLGFYMLECDSLDQAVAAARELQQVNTSAVYEIRPVRLYLPGEPVRGG